MLEIKREKENRSKQTRPFTSKVATVLKVSYAKRDFKHNATNVIYKSLMHLDENDIYVVRKGGEHTATSKKRGM